MLAFTDRHDLARISRAQFRVVSEEAALRRSVEELVEASLKAVARFVRRLVLGELEY